jgi:peptidyl-prolyl cis-trans isomerase C
MENKVLVKVNGTEITELDLRQTISRFPAERQAQFNTEEGIKQLLDQMVSFELVYSFAKENGIDSDEAFQMQLKNAEREILTQYAISKILADVQVTEDEAKAYYTENQSMFIEEPSVRARHILVQTLEEANKVLEDIKSGMSFETAAETYSSCPSKAQGGDLGSFTKGRMVPEFEEAAFALEEGKVSEPVKTQFGYHIIRVDEKQAPSLLTFDRVKDNIGNNMLQAKQNYRYTEFTEALKNKYGVEYTDK